MKMTDIKTNYNRIRSEVEQTLRACRRPAGSAVLVAVSKRKSAARILEAVEAGADHFGENYIQEAVEKIESIQNDGITWHFIGHLQSNKARFAVRYFDYIHTVDSKKLAGEIDKQAKKIGKVQKILLQVNIGAELSKSGTDIDLAVDLAGELTDLPSISVQGLMCMPPFFDDPEDAREYFRKLVEIRDRIIARQFKNIFMNHLSMGMSNDFRVAIEEGSTMVRVGTSIFGERE